MKEFVDSIKISTNERKLDSLIDMLIISPNFFNNKRSA